MFAGQGDAQFLDRRADTGGERQRQQRADHAEEFRAREERDRHRDGREAQRLAVDTRDDDAALQLLVEHERDEDDERHRHPSGEREKHRRGGRQHWPDVRNEIGESGENRQNQGVRDVQDEQQDIGEAADQPQR